MADLVIDSNGAPEAPARAASPGWRSAVSAALGSWQARIGVVLLGGYVVLAIVGAIWDLDTDTSSALREGPSGDHLLGTDSLGRDVLQRTIAGAPTMVTVSFAAAITCVATAALIGALIAYRGGLVEASVMRLVDVLLSFPTILVALLAAALLPPSNLSVFLVVAVVQIPVVVRVTVGVFADVFSRDYITVAALRGESAVSVIGREALPNVAGPLLVELARRLGASVLLIASLNFLGVGAQPPASDWGLMLLEGRNDIFIAPWSVVVPALAIGGLAVAINFTADGVANAIGRGRDGVGETR